MNENPCSNYEIHVLFKNACYFDNTQNYPQFVCLTLHGKAFLSKLVITSMLLVTKTLYAL